MNGPWEILWSCLTGEIRSKRPYTHTAATSEINSVITLLVLYNRGEKRETLTSSKETPFSHSAHSLFTKHSTQSQMSLLGKRIASMPSSTYLTKLSTQGRLGFLQASAVKTTYVIIEVGAAHYKTFITERLKVHQLHVFWQFKYSSDMKTWMRTQFMQRKLHLKHANTKLSLLLLNGQMQARLYQNAQKYSH